MRARIGIAILAVALGVGLFALGHATVDTGAARDHGFRDGNSAGFSDGLRTGVAQGRQEGRALQVGESVAPQSRTVARDAFNAGYTAGQDDVFAGYDGGWVLGAPYVITLGRGTGKITERIASRTPVEKNVNYYLCPNGHDVCHQPRR
jgi:hypothetical protein